MKVRIQKRSEVTGGLPAADKTEYIPGTGGVEGKSLPIDYWLTGDMPNPPKVGECVFVLRDTRNGVACPGLFQTTPVTEVTETSFRTKNSVYDYSLLTSDKEEVSLPA
jgi:hypothetical protein